MKIEFRIRSIYFQYSFTESIFNLQVPLDLPDCISNNTKIGIKWWSSILLHGDMPIYECTFVKTEAVLTTDIGICGGGLG